MLQTISNLHPNMPRPYTIPSIGAPAAVGGNASRTLDATISPLLLVIQTIKQFGLVFFSLLNFGNSHVVKWNHVVCWWGWIALPRILVLKLQPQMTHFRSLGWCYGNIPEFNQNPFVTLLHLYASRSINGVWIHLRAFRRKIFQIVGPVWIGMVCPANISLLAYSPKHG